LPERAEIAEKHQFFFMRITNTTSHTPPLSMLCVTIDEPTDYISNALNSTTKNKEISS
jgi:hypothetical protein